MRSLTRASATAATALAFTASGLVTAAPAAAGPLDGCAGLPEMPAAYVCIVTNPTGGLPGVASTPVPVRVPPVCYIAGCTQATVVNVPVPSTTEPSGNIAVLTYQGRTYPIGIGLDVVWPIVEDVQILAGGAVAKVGATVDNLPTTGELLLAIHDIVDPVVDDQMEKVEDELAYVARIVDRLPELMQAIRERVQEILDDRPGITLADVVEIVQDFLRGEDCSC